MRVNVRNDLGKKRPTGGARGPQTAKNNTQTRRAQNSDARRCAYYALSQVLRSGAYAAIALNEQFKTHALTPEDKRLATNIFYTALENLLRIDHVLALFMERMPEPAVLDCLRVAVSQILFMDRIPAHAAVDEAIKQLKRMKRDGFAGMANAVLRNIVRARDAKALTYPERAEGLVKHLSVLHSMPEWVIEKLIGQYGEDQAEQIVAYRPQRRSETVRYNPLKMTAGEFTQYADSRGWSYEQTPIPGVLEVFSAGQLASDQDFRRGVYSLQAQGSVLAAMAVEPKRGGEYLDACAAPGGKSAWIAEAMGLTGRVYAWDLHAHRVELIKHLSKRLGLDNLRPMERDATVYREELAGLLDGVLIDAPCSGFGVIADKPDIKYRVKQDALPGLHRLQRDLLNACQHYVKPGGLLVYSTCTVFADENEGQIEAFLKDHPDFVHEENLDYLPEVWRQHSRQGMVQLLAHRDHADGFFIARLRRRS